MTTVKKQIEQKKQFHVSVIRTDQFDISIDETIWDRNALDDWEKHFFKVKDLNEIAEHIAFNISRFGSLRFIEGFGYINTFTSIKNAGKIKWISQKQFEGNKLVTPEKYCKGIAVRIVSEDDEIETSSKEMEVTL